jgi:hypothetical protein
VATIHIDDGLAEKIILNLPETSGPNILCAWLALSRIGNWIPLEARRANQMNGVDDRGRR